MALLVTQLLHDEAGFIVSAELVLVATILVIGMIVGLSEVANGINQELEDVASAFASVNQSYCFSGFNGHKAWEAGSHFQDAVDFCDSQFDINGNGSQPESNSSHN